MNRTEAAAIEATHIEEFTSPRGPVLVVDNDPATRRVLRLVIEGAGFDCVASETAKDAAALVEELRPRLVLVEVDPQQIGGAELAGQLAHEGLWRPRVALMSSFPRSRKGLEDFFLPKPIEFDQLLGILEIIERDPDR